MKKGTKKRVVNRTREKNIRTGRKRRKEGLPRSVEVVCGMWCDGGRVIRPFGH